MENLHFQRPAHTGVKRRALVGYVGSGDLEVMIEPCTTAQADIHILTSSPSSETRWRQVLERIEAVQPGHQPLRRKCRQRGQVEGASAGAV